MSERDLAGYAAVFYPGGHAPMEDLAQSQASGRVLRHFHSEGKTTALVCHGPAALLSARAGRDWPYQGYRMTVFSNSEEAQSHLASQVTYSVEDELSAAGGAYERGKDWEPTVVEDRELITGQNPMSSLELARRLVARLKPAYSLK